MIELRPFAGLGHADLGWLDTSHHFSFADYHDDARMHWGSLRVWNDDIIMPNTGFPTHPHASMEIITYVRRGAITHQDSLGNLGRTVAGDVQVMSAGKGIRHSEFNREDIPTEIFQIWILPSERGGEPSWGTRPFPHADRSGRFVTLASGFAEDDQALPIRTPGRVCGATVKAGETLTYEMPEGRVAYLVALGSPIEVNGVRAEPRDGVAVRDERKLTITTAGEAEVVMVDAYDLK